MQDDHERVEHLRGHRLINLLVLIVAHDFACRNAGTMVRDYLMIVYVVDELHDLLLITESVAVTQILALVVFVHALLELRSHLN